MGKLYFRTHSPADEADICSWTVNNGLCTVARNASNIHSCDEHTEVYATRMHDDIALRFASTVHSDWRDVATV